MRSTGSKTNYRLLGADVPGIIGFTGLSAGFKIFYIASLIGIFSIIAVYAGLIGWTKTSVNDLRNDLELVNETLSSDLELVNLTLCEKIVQGDALLQAQILGINVGDLNLTLGIQLAALNETLCDKIMMVNTTLLASVDSVLGIFDSVNMSIYFDLNQALVEANATLQQELALINDTLCAKIMAGDAALQDQLSAINLGDLNVTLGSQLSDLNDTLCAKFMAGDSALQMDLMMLNSSLIAQIGAALVSVNNVTGALDDMGLLNLSLVASGPGIEIENDPMGHEIRLKNTGIATINSVSSMIGSSDLLMTGAGMITINSFPNSSTIEIDGTALSTALSNLQMQSNMQQMEIAYLEGNVTNLQTQINNIQMVGDMIAQDLNGTTVNFNMTLMELVMDVMTLQSTVVALQAQIDSLNSNSSSSGGNPTGTIVPFGGTVIPTGYLLCDGTQYSTATYSDLFTVVGTMYCPGPCSMGMFAVPDLRGKVPAGQGGTALSGTIGSSVGTETHVLSSAEMPVHTHTGTTSADGLHQHTMSNYFTFSITSVSDGWQREFSPTPNLFHYQIATLATGSAGSHSHTMSLNNAGSGTAHNNVQPSLIVKYMIKT